MNLLEKYLGHAKMKRWTLLARGENNPLSEVSNLVTQAYHLVLWSWIPTILKRRYLRCVTLFRAFSDGLKI